MCTGAVSLEQRTVSVAGAERADAVHTLPASEWYPACPVLLLKRTDRLLPSLFCCTVTCIGDMQAVLICLWVKNLLNVRSC